MCADHTEEESDAQEVNAQEGRKLRRVRSVDIIRFIGILLPQLSQMVFQDSGHPGGLLCSVTRVKEVARAIWFHFLPRY
jgi:hypothetical protein